MKTFLLKWRAVLLIVVVTILAYGLLIPWLGFYMDDWTFNWTYQTFGSQGLFHYFSTNRPVWGLIYQITLPLLQDHILAWHLFGLFWRIVASLSFYWFLTLLWPKKKGMTLTAGLLFAIYPGFLLQPLALTFGHIWLIYTVFILSNCFTILAIKYPIKRWRYLIAALLLSAVNILCMEYFLPLEVIRLAVIFYLIAEPMSFFRRLGRAIKIWAPYLTVLLLVTLYRAFFFKDQTHIYSLYLLDAFKHSLAAGFSMLWNEVLSALYQSAVYAWAQPFLAIAERAGKNRTFLAIAALMVMVLAGLILILQRAMKTSAGEDASKREFSPLLIAVCALLLAGIPFYVTALPVQAANINSRFTLPFMVGATILLAFLIDLIPICWVKVGLLSLVITSSIGFNLFNANDYRLMQVHNNELMYELWWRAPSLKPGTLVITTEQTESKYFTYSTLRSELNLIYPHDASTSYGWVFSRDLANMMTTPATADTKIHIPMIVQDFNGNSDQAVVFQIGDLGCARFIDNNSVSISKYIADYSFQNISDAESLVSSAGQMVKLDASLVGPEPAHRWCYYFEKSDLALQQKDYASIQKYYQTVNEKSLEPQIYYEWAPFIEGLARGGDWQDSVKLAQQVIAEGQKNPATQIKKDYQSFACQIFTKLSQESSFTKKATDVMTKLGCEQ